jgi:ATP-dependent DNA ligase
MAVAKAKRQDQLADLVSKLRPVPIPVSPKPMLCTLVAEPFDNPDWVFEPKFDGMRVLGRFDGKELVLLSRNDQPQNFQFPDVAECRRERPRATPANGRESKSPQHQTKPHSRKETR